MTLHRRTPWLARWSELAIALCLAVICFLVGATVATGVAIPERTPYVVVTYGDEDEAPAEPG